MVSAILAFLFPIISLAWGVYVLRKGVLRLSASERFVYTGNVAKIFGYSVSIFSALILITIIILGLNDLGTPER